MALGIFFCKKMFSSFFFVFRLLMRVDIEISPSIFLEMWYQTIQRLSLYIIEQVSLIKKINHFFVFLSINFKKFSLKICLPLVVESSLVTFLQASLINYHATVTNFQLLDVEFPTTFSSAISDTQVFFFFFKITCSNFLKKL